MRALWLVLLVASPAWAQMYKCVDQNGVTHYTDAPRPGCKGGQVDIRPSPPISGALGGRAEDFARQEAEFKRRQGERSRAEAKERAALQARCKRLRGELARLSSGRPLARIDASGERVYVPDQEREQRVAQVHGALRACP